MIAASKKFINEQQFQIQNEFALFQRSAKMLKIISPNYCKGFSY